MKALILIFCLFTLLSCNSLKDIYSTPLFGAKGGVNAIIEIPGGTNKKVEFDPVSQQFKVDQRNGKDRIISFLSYPGNYGFIPSTYSDPSKGGDGDALDVLVISEALPIGTIIEIIPIAILKLEDNGEKDYKIIGVPHLAIERTISATTHLELERDYPKIREILTQWFSSYDKKDTLKVLGWGDEKEALEEIQKHQKS